MMRLFCDYGIENQALLDGALTSAQATIARAEEVIALLQQHGPSRQK